MTPEQTPAAEEGAFTFTPATSASSVKPQPLPSLPYNEKLSAREVEVLQLVSQGLTNHQIAEQLVLSPHTVNVHVQAIYGKLGVSTRAGATRYAFEHHLL